MDDASAAHAASRDGRRAAIEALEREATVQRPRFPARLGPGETVWRQWGSTGPAVMLLHGGTGSWLHWYRTVLALRSRFRLFAVDIPGMGDSSMPPVTAPVEDLIRTTAAIVAEGWRTITPGGGCGVHVCGFSFGSMVGAHAARLLGGDVRSFTMVGGSGLGLEFEGAGPLVKPRAGMSEAERRAMHRHNMVTILFADPAHADDLALEMQIHNAERMRLRTHTSARTEIMLEALSHLRVPLHAIWGARDPFLPAGDQALRLLRTFDPEVEVVRIEDAGHWAAHEGAADFGRALEGFLLGPRVAR